MRDGGSRSWLAYFTLVQCIFMSPCFTGWNLQGQCTREEKGSEAGSTSSCRTVFKGVNGFTMSEAALVYTLISSNRVDNMYK